MKQSSNIYVLLCLIICIHYVNGQAFSELNAVNPKYPGYCYYKSPYTDAEIIVKEQQTKRLEDACGYYRCNAGFSISYIGCGVMGGPSYCRVLPGDLSKPHPECCPELIC